MNNHAQRQRLKARTKQREKWAKPTRSTTGSTDWAFNEAHAQPSPVKVIMSDGVAAGHRQSRADHKVRERKAKPASKPSEDGLPQVSTCKRCGGPIGWRKTRKGKWVPLSLNGGDHWAECEEWRASERFLFADPAGLDAAK